MTVRVFVSGQSNVLGRGTGGPSLSLVSADVSVWNSVNPLGSLGTAFVSASSAQAAGTFENTDRNNLAVWFCDRLSKHLNDDVEMVIAARGNSSITLWDPSEATFPMLQSCIDVYAQSGAPPADIFLWHQGEANVSTPSYTDYKTAFLALVQNLKNAGVIASNATVLIGELIPENANRINFNREALLELAQENDFIFLANSQGMQTFDGTHFDAPALYRMGAEKYFAAYLSSLGESLYALVNEGGTPGDAGSGENKVLDVGGLVRAGYRLKGAPIFLTVTGTYYTPPDVKAISVEVIGGGGGGAGATSSSGVARMGRGGAAGGYACAFIENPEASYDYVIGAAGAAGAAGANNGTTGGTTTFGLALSAAGGNPGAAFTGTADQVTAGPVSGGAASGGDFNVEGEPSVMAIKLTAALRMSGGGGRTKYGSGGRGATAGSDATVGNGFAATGYGSGGGGGLSSTTTDAAGGAGAQGVVVVWEYVR